MQIGFKSNYQTLIKAPVEKVWQALTNPATVKEYFFGTDLFTDWKVNSSIVWQGEFEGKAYQDKGIILEFVPNQKLSFSYLSSWANLEDKLENYLFVSYELKTVAEGTELNITQANYNEEKAQHSAENWAMLINELKKVVE